MSSIANCTEKLVSCPACDGAEFVRVTLPDIKIGMDFFCDGRGGEGFALTRCRRCGLEFANPRPSFESLMAFYNRPGYPAHGLETATDRETPRLRLDLLPSCCSGGSLLDYGCGGGRFLVLASEAGWRVVGVEPSEVGQTTARRRGLEVYGGLDALASRVGTFDVVTMFHVLEHVTEARRVLSGIRTLLMSGGTLVVEVPNLRSIRARVMTRARRTALDDERYRAFPIHLYGFNRTTLKKLLVRSGYRVLRTTTYGLGLARAKEDMCAGDKQGRVVHREVVQGATKRFVKACVLRVIGKAHLGENLIAFASPGPVEQEN